MKKSNTSQRLKQIMSEKNLRQADILRAAEPYCKRYGIKLAKNDLSQYVNGKVEPGQEKLTILGLALGVSEAWLMGYDVHQERDAKEEHPTGYDGMSADRQAMLDFIDNLSDDQVHRLLHIARAAFDQQTN